MAVSAETKRGLGGMRSRTPVRCAAVSATVTIPDDGPIQVLWQDKRAQSLTDVDPDQVRNTLMEGLRNNSREG